MGDMELQVFSERLKELRSSLGLTQSEFIDGLGITASALSAYEKNLKNPSISVAKRIAEKYKVSIDWLCGLSDKRKNTDEIETYSDAIRLIIRLCDIDFLFGRCEPVYRASDINDLSRGGIDTGFIRIIEKDLVVFIKDWIQMKDLYNKGTIPAYLYQLWIDDKLRQYDRIIEEAPFN